MNAPPSFGAALIGFACCCFLCGCMLVQVYIYSKSKASQRDSKLFKYFIATLWFIDILHLIMVGIYVYGALIVHFDDAPYLSYGPWSFDAVTALSALSSTPIQFFYAWRVYILGNRNRVLPACICLLSTVALAFSMVTTALAHKAGNFAKYGSFTWAVDVWLGSNVVTDIMIVASLYYFLSRGRSGYTSTDQLIDKLIYIVSSTGLAPALMELAHIISFSAAGNSYAHLVFNFIAPKLYMNSLMASLNARHFIFANTSASQTLNNSSQPRSERFELHTVTGNRSSRVPIQDVGMFDVKITTDFESKVI